MKPQGNVFDISIDEIKLATARILAEAEKHKESEPHITAQRSILTALQQTTRDEEAKVARLRTEAGGHQRTIDDANARADEIVRDARTAADRVKAAAKTEADKIIAEAKAKHAAALAHLNQD